MGILSELAKSKKESSNGGILSRLANSSRMSEENLTKAANNIQSQLEEYQKNLNTYVTDYNDRAGSRVAGNYVNDAEDYADLTTRQKAWFDTSAQRINKLLDKYGSGFSKEYVDSVRKALSSNGQIVDQINQTATTPLIRPPLYTRPPAARRKNRAALP